MNLLTHFAQFTLVSIGGFIMGACMGAFFALFTPLVCWEMRDIEGGTWAVMKDGFKTMPILIGLLGIVAAWCCLL